MLVTCLNCSTEFNKQPSQIKRSSRHFCSCSCSATFNNKGKTKNPPKVRACKNCNGQFTKRTSGGSRSSVYCSSCFLALPSRRELTLGYIKNGPAVKGRHPSWRWAQVREFARRWNKPLLELPCANCGYSKHVELAHIRAISSFPETATLGEVNAPSNVIQLCRNCHWEFDHGLLQLKQHPQQESNLHVSN